MVELNFEKLRKDYRSGKIYRDGERQHVYDSIKQAMASNYHWVKCNFISKELEQELIKSGYKVKLSHDSLDTIIDF